MPTSEFDLIYRYFSSLGAGPAVDLSVGDDCAILRLQPGERLATSVDTMVEGVHFTGDMFPEDTGFRAVSVAASDLAAMGARPIGMTVALTLPEADEFWINAFSQGLAQAVSGYRLPLVGGDTTRGPLTITVQVLGALPAGLALRREGARPGDAVYVSGTLGDAAAALAFLQDQWQPEPEAAEYLLQRYHRPQARIDLGQQLLGKATSAIDISDGLLADAGHIAAASGVALHIDPDAIPLSTALQSHAERDTILHWALAGGDDYELCFTLPPGEPAPTGCSRIGQVQAGQGVHTGLGGDLPTGFQHFS
ncbi:thiamine-phosphate kinase [Seongchinamella sediminis]|uniref:Thiamine-monophosphate kinase n=1 Tax=Seongchinamella sediminis TaxID=2283635 RepID=A0A3L7DZY8_9GAMM|nr:thiamine-phosphate kinase [Seongchinamella sediminis]RLQ22229.1 thiamine-phosphate kinase [Seongchinamella sediminis]